MVVIMEEDRHAQVMGRLLYIHDNQVYTPNGKVTECNMSLADWQAKGNDPGTTANMWPSDEDLVEKINNLLAV